MYEFYGMPLFIFMQHEQIHRFQPVMDGRMITDATRYPSKINAAGIMTAKTNSLRAFFLRSFLNRSTLLYLICNTPGFLQCQKGTPLSRLVPFLSECVQSLLYHLSGESCYCPEILFVHHFFSTSSMSPSYSLMIFRTANRLFVR